MRGKRIGTQGARKNFEDSPRFKIDRNRFSGSLAFRSNRPVSGLESSLVPRNWKKPNVDLPGATFESKSPVERDDRSSFGVVESGASPSGFRGIPRRRGSRRRGGERRDTAPFVHFWNDLAGVRHRGHSHLERSLAGLVRMTRFIARSGIGRHPSGATGERS